MSAVAVSVSPSSFRHSASFSPTDLTATILNGYNSASWTTSGSDVTGWSDVSGNSRDMSPTGSVTLVSDGGPNGGPCIRFDGSTGYLRDSYSETGANHVFLVCKPQRTPANDTTTLLDGGTANGRRIYKQNQTTYGAYRGATLTTTAGVDVDTWQFIEALYDASSSRIRVDAGTASTGSTGSLPQDHLGLILGAYGSTTLQFADMDVLELWITAPLTGSDLTNMRAYMLGLL
jgi:hypothetical protein